MYSKTNYIQVNIFSIILCFILYLDPLNLDVREEIGLTMIE